MFEFEVWSVTSVYTLRTQTQTNLTFAKKS